MAPQGSSQCADWLSSLSQGVTGDTDPAFCLMVVSGPRGGICGDTDMGGTVKDGAPGVQRQGPRGYTVLIWVGQEAGEGEWPGPQAPVVFMSE